MQTKIYPAHPPFLSQPPLTAKTSHESQTNTVLLEHKFACLREQKNYTSLTKTAAPQFHFQFLVREISALYHTMPFRHSQLHNNILIRD